jgi:hypothetical protein
MFTMARCIAKTSKGTQCEKNAIKGSLFCSVHRRQRIWRRTLSVSVIGAMVLGILGFVANVAGILDFLGIKPPLISSLSVPESPYPSGSIGLVTTNDQRIFVTTADNHPISSGDTIKTQDVITATFKIMNTGIYPVTIRSLVLGARGPGVSCENKNEQKWAAPDNSFPPTTNLRLEPGQEYEYVGSRSFYKPGTYFLEPVFQDAKGKWGGIHPFSCINIVVETKP